MVEQNVGVADQSRISIADTTNNTPTNSNDASIGTKEPIKKEMKWILDLLLGNTSIFFLKIIIS